MLKALLEAVVGKQLFVLIGGSILLCLASGLVAQDDTRNNFRRGGSGSASRKNQPIYREGTKIVNQLGFFNEASESISFNFEVDGKTVSLRALENLALERVANELLNNSTAEPPRWSVSGRLTEFRGSNYILVQRAILKVKK